MSKYLVITEEESYYAVYMIEAGNKVEATAIYQSTLGGHDEKIINVFSLDGSGDRLVAAIKKVGK